MIPLDEQATTEQSSPTSFRLSTLSLLANDDEVIETRVLDWPIRGARMVWIIDSQPSKQFASGQKIIPRTSKEVIGVDRFSNLDGLYRYWASFVLWSGRVPMSTMQSVCSCPIVVSECA